MTHSLRLLIPAAALVAGCSPAGPRMVRVSGAVTFDGEPIPEGDIVFRPLAINYGPEGGKIKDGKYELLVKEGESKVEINASKSKPLPPGARNPDGDRMSEPIDYIPAKFNVKTTLTAKPDRDRTTFDFDLKSR